MISLYNPTDRSAFYDIVYEIIKAIPHGKVMTYGDIAALIPPPINIDPMSYSQIRARWVGYALAFCGDDIPWHRVINSKGQISKRLGQGPYMQRQYLEDEGVVFDMNDNVDLNVYRWKPPTDRLLRAVRIARAT